MSWGKWGIVNQNFSSVSQSVQILLFLCIKPILGVNMIKKIIYIYVKINIYTYKFGFIFSQLYFCFPRVRGKVKLYQGKVDKTKKKTNI